MDFSIEKELAALRRMSVGQLRGRYAELFGEPARSRHKQWLIKRILWRRQTLAEGDLSQRARRRAEELANDADCGFGPRGRLPRLPARKWSKPRRQVTRGFRRPGSFSTRIAARRTKPRS